jgi:competence protein ComEA
MKQPRMTHLIALVLALFIFAGFAGVAIAEDEIVSLNKATVEELMAIEDVEMSEELAKSIVAHREKNGPFKSATDLTTVPGMTNDVLEDLNPVESEDGSDVVYDPDAEPALAPSKC